MPRSFDHDLYVMVPRALGELAERHEFGNLGGVVRVREASGPQTVTKREGHVVFGEDIAQFVEMRVQEAFPLMLHAPLRHD